MDAEKGASKKTPLFVEITVEVIFVFNFLSKKGGSGVLPSAMPWDQIHNLWIYSSHKSHCT